MRTIIALALIALSVSNTIISRRHIEHLKKVAPWEVYEYEENPFRDYTDEEIHALMGDLSINDIVEEKDDFYPGKYNDVPESYDWRKEFPNCQMRIKDQASCGSCWAFAGSTAFEHRVCQHSQGKQNVELSPQNLVSCDTASFACNGGGRQSTWAYFQKTGIVEEKCWPYSSAGGSVEPCRNTCKNGDEWKPFKVSGYTSFTNEMAIKNDLVENGPIHTGFQCYSDFMNYKGGIYHHVSGSLQGGHAVVFHGYGVENGEKYWICQNSWGPDWGESGYFRIRIGDSQIDVNSVAGIPIV